MQVFFQKLYDAGYIYAGEYEALYCVGCEEFKPESEIVDGTGPFEGLKVCAIHSKPLELLQEKNYFFKLSEFQDRLLELYKTEPDFVQPRLGAQRGRLVRVAGARRTCPSRAPAFDWGIPLPWDTSHVIYVWVDALLNYVTAVGLRTDPSTGSGSDEFARRWPAYHVVGKDILRFHAVIWPAMLMAAGLEVPKRRVRARLAARRRREDVEVEAHRHRADRDHRRVRIRRVPVLLPLARSRSGRTDRSPGRTCRRATRPSSRTASATSPRARSR